MNYRTYYKNIRRTISGSLGRYIAIMAIIALGVGFFAGIKVCKDSMVKTCSKYTVENKMYDYRLISDIGFDDKDVRNVAEADGVRNAEGAFSVDFYSTDASGNETVFRAHSLMKEINIPSLVEGRMPESRAECVGDKEHFSSEDIGRMITVTDSNSSDVKKSFADREMKLVGLIDSVYYIQRTDRGTSSLGDGSIDAYIYAPEDAFDMKYFTEIYAVSEKQGYIYTKDYDRNIKREEKTVKAVTESSIYDRFCQIKEDALADIEDGQKKIDEGRRKLEDEKIRSYDQLASAKATLDRKSAELADAEKKLPAVKQTLLDQQQQLEKGIEQLEAAILQEQAALDAAIASGAPEEQIEFLQGQISQHEQQKAGLQSSLSQVKAGISSLPGRESEIRAGKKKLAAGYREYRQGKSEADSAFASAEAELDKSQRKIDKALKKLNDMEEPELYVFLREDNTGYMAFDDNTDIVDSLAKVFPIFFFLIAALVCSTTMTRMVEEERTQIGTMRALGYTRGRIMWKYLFYSGSAAVLGSLAGFFLGSKFFPIAVWAGYGMIFGFAPLEYYFDWKLLLMALFASVLCSSGTTFLACRGQLADAPAQIMRPKAPKAGKRILLERVRPIWSRMKFTYKVTARNLFRYKKRMAMMIVGIAGCTALVLAGFGIYDSIAGLADHQYTEIEKYDMTVGFSQTVDDKEKEEFLDECGEDISIMVPLQMSAVNAKEGKKRPSCSLMVTDDPESLTKLVNFREGVTDGPELAYPGEGEALINNKVAEVLNLKKGDTVTVCYDDTKEVKLKVSGIYRNFVNNYIYITDETFEKDMGKEYKPFLAFIKAEEGKDLQTVSREINSFEDVMSVSLNEETRLRIDKMMDSLHFIIWLVIGCAGALAFIVLFNLGNINLTERVREIATIEVLGFYPFETGQYVFRENLILVLFGIACGLPAGVMLHKFIMSRIVVDLIAFNNVIYLKSYFFATAMVILFTLMVDMVMRLKLRKIKMAEALKSAE